MVRKNSIQKFYDTYESIQIEEPEIYETAKKYLKEPVLDVGCYDGNKILKLRALGFKEIQGTDIAIKLSPEAKKLSTKTFFTHNFEHGATKKKYGSVLCVEVLEHVFDTNAFLKNIAKSLKKGGTVVFTTPNLGWVWDRAMILLGKGKRLTGGFEKSHIRFFTVQTAREAFEKNGFMVQSIKGYEVKRFLKHVPMPTTWRCGLIIVAKKK